MPRRGAIGGIAGSTRPERTHKPLTREIGREGGPDSWFSLARWRAGGRRRLKTSSAFWQKPRPCRLAGQSAQRVDAQMAQNTGVLHSNSIRFVAAGLGFLCRCGWGQTDVVRQPFRLVSGSLRELGCLRLVLCDCDAMCFFNSKPEPSNPRTPQTP